MKIWTINPLRHPFWALAYAIRRWTLREDQNQSTADGKDFDGGAIPPQLQRYHQGEILPWKGLTFKVGKVVGGEFPCVILVPVGLTHGAKLRGLRNLRDRTRARLAEERAIASALKGAQ